MTYFEKEKAVKLVKYTGTIESYNELVEALWNKKCDYYHIWFLDDKSEITPKFTGIVCDTLNGVVYRPGDHFIVKMEILNE